LWSGRGDDGQHYARDSVLAAATARAEVGDEGSQAGERAHQQQYATEVVRHGHSEQHPAGLGVFRPGQAARGRAHSGHRGVDGTGADPLQVGYVGARDHGLAVDDRR